MREMRHSPCHKSLVFVLLKLREAYLSIAQVKESNKVNEVLDLCSLHSRRPKVLMAARKNRGCKWDTQGQREFPPTSHVSIAHVSIMHPFFLTYYFQAPAKQARIHGVRIKLYSWFSQSEMDVTFFITTKLIPWFCDRCKYCSMTLNMLQLSHWKEGQKQSQNNISNTTDHVW